MSTPLEILGTVIYLILWISTVFYIRPKNKALRIIVYAMVIFFAPILYVNKYNGFEGNYYFQEAYGRGDDGSFTSYKMGPFSGIVSYYLIWKDLDFDWNGNGRGVTATPYPWAEPYDESHQSNIIHVAKSSPVFFYFLFIATAIFINRRFLRPNKLPARRKFRYGMIAFYCFSGLALVYNCLHFFIGGSQVTFFIFQLFLLAALTIVLLSILKFKRPYLVLVLSFLLFPVLSPSSDCLCPREIFSEAQKIHYPAYQSLPFAAVDLAKSFLDPDCDCNTASGDEYMLFKGHFEMDEAAKLSSGFSIFISILLLFQIGNVLYQSVGKKDQPLSE